MRYLHTLDTDEIRELAMAWRYKYPMLEDYESEEKYEEACAMYETMEGDYADHEDRFFKDDE